MHRQLPWTVGNLVILILIGALQLSSQNTPQIERLDPALDALVASDTAIEKVATGFQFTEGPVWDRAGILFFTDINAAVINQWSSGGRVVPFLGPAVFTGKDLAVAGVPGANGLTIDREGRLAVCDQGHRVISRVEKDGKITVLADRYQGKGFNSPNDLNL